MSDLDRKSQILLVLAASALFVLAFIGIPWTWTLESIDPGTATGALAYLIRSIAVVFVVSFIIVAVRWSK